MREGIARFQDQNPRAIAPSDLSRQARGQCGFTLLEMVMVIVITGIIGSITASFIQRPLQAYFDASKRAGISDAADLALRRIQRDVRLALPNSVRTTVAGGPSRYLEWVPTLAVGRYENSTAASCFSSSCGSLVVLGNLIANAHDYAGKSLVIYNLSNNVPSNCAAMSAYCGNNVVSIADSVAASGSPPKGSLTFSAPVQLNAAGASDLRHRFHIIDGPVSYECNPTTKQLIRHWGYGLQAAQPTSFGSGNSALLADHVDCSFTYQSGGGLQRAILGLSVALSSADGAESVSLYYELAVNNVP